MTDVDFTRAKLRWVEFRGLDMETVRFPADSDHLVVKDYPRTLVRLSQEFDGRTDIPSRRLANYFGMDRKWAGPKQSRGVFNKNDLLEIGGDEGLRRVLKVIEQANTCTAE
jgi:hypothetical protein